MITDLKFDPETINGMFPCHGDDGENVVATINAEVAAWTALNVPFGTLINWHLPDVFAVRYGSSYVATASLGDDSVRFHMTEGDFQEGDDRA